MTPDLEIFAPKRARWDGRRLIDFIQANEKFDSSILERSIKAIIRKKTGDENSPLKPSETPAEGDCKVFVCSVLERNSEPVFLRSYESSSLADPLSDDFDLWQALRATSAASTFFYAYQRGAKKFVDGGFTYNNPVQRVMIEAADLWGTDRPALLISIGTGERLGESLGGNLREVAKGMIKMLTQTERTADDFFSSQHDMVDRGMYFRFNVPGLATIGMEEYKEVDAIDSHTISYLTRGTTGKELSAVVRKIRNIQTVPSKRIGFRRRPQGTNFFGRSCEVENLHRFLNPGGTTREGVVIWGLSGYGKTQLAIHYIDNYWPSHMPVIWIDASSRESIEGVFDDVATELQTPDARCKASIHDVMRWLCRDTNKSWLLVFDSVDINEDLDIRKYFPNCEHGSIIITTTRSDIHSPLKFHGIELEGVDDLAGSQILLGYLARVLPDEFRNQSTKEQAEITTMAISRKLRGIPLAIEQAGAFLSLGTVGIRYYLEHFEQKYREDTYNTLPLQYGYSYEKRRTIYAALDMVHEVLRTQNPDSVKLLNVSVFLGPGEIEFSTLADAPLPEEYYGFESNRASSSRDAERLPNTPSWLIRLRNQARYFGTAIQKLEQVSLMKINRQGSQIMSYVVHEMETVEIPDGKYASLWGSVASGFGKFCRIQGQLVRAKELLTTALEYRTYSGKPVEHEHLTELEELAAVDWRLGNLVEAIDRYESLLDDCNCLLGNEDAMTLRVANALRNVRERQDSWRRYQENAYSGASGPKRDYGIANEPPQYQDMDNEEWELVASYEEARQLLNKNDTETLQRAQELAAYYRKCARPDKECPVREYIWQYYSTVPGHVRVESLRNLCNCYRESGKFTAIRSLLLGTEECSVFSAAIEGNIDLCELLAKQTFNVDRKDHYDCSSMHWAVEGGHLPMLEWLLGKGADVNSRDGTRATVLHWAASNGDTRASQLLLEGGADIEARDNDGRTALHWAAASGHKDVVSVLLERGADIEAKDNGGRTALHWAAASGRKDVVSVLLEGGADIEAKDNGGWTAQRWATSAGHKAVAEQLTLTKDKRFIPLWCCCISSGYNSPQG
ncbi:hypothetical protein QL093DRAFT_2639535 [Fusarium oxysporum]|nr:hypothetical protein QL093DRAFT_2639535 [Fusarium oxysporum]